MAKKKQAREPRVAAVDEMGVLKRDIGRMVFWIVISVAVAALVAVGVETYLV
ncbi:hypothetical protein MK805_16760 [Shimazuella sp. AN120528]|uniref:hypothetical protein n=1 Tax=Shimazuella soli TaxID=1892854 RepID=UPI001F0F65CA|nr:hypothetical protein [Shimazuella soli]MCH5586592.1 hypothetical protein [Shimazuella soli]